MSVCMSLRITSLLLNKKVHSAGQVHVGKSNTSSDLRSSCLIQAILFESSFFLLF